jgi:hypothetical protein
VFSNRKSNSLACPFQIQLPAVSRSESSFHNLNTSKPHTENAQVTHLHGDNDLIDLDSSKSGRSSKNDELVNGPAQIQNWVHENSPVLHLLPTFDSEEKEDYERSIAKKSLTPQKPIFNIDPISN